MSEPLDQVLTRAWGDFTPKRPGRAPWHQPSHLPVEVAYTGNVAVVPLEIADRVRLRNVGRPSGLRDDTGALRLDPGGLGRILAVGEPPARGRPATRLSRLSG